MKVKMKSSETLKAVPGTHCRFAPLALGSVKARGWLERQTRIEADGMSGHMDQLEPDMIGNPYLTRSVQKDAGVAWCAEISATYWAGLVQLAFTLDDPSLKEKAENWVNGVLAIQEADGYIGAYRPTDNRKEDYNAFGVAWVIIALTSFYEATGRVDVLEACRRGLRWFVNDWGKHKTDYAGPTLIEALVLVYLHTNDKHLLDWAEEYMEWLTGRTSRHNSVPDLAGPLLDYNSAHAVAYGIWMSLPAILSVANGRQDYLRASENAIRKVLRKCFQRTGAPASNNETLSPPGATCETEYCNFGAYAHSFAWMARITGKPTYGDLVEKVVFNGSQGAKKKDGKAIAYMSSPNQYFATSHSSVFGNCPDMEVYAPVYRVACCPAQAVRVLPEYVRGLCLFDRRGGLVFPCYGPCRIEAEPSPGVRVVIEESTEYPFREMVEFRVTLNRPARFPIRLHIPAWCHKASLTINDKPLERTMKANRYIAVSRTWKSGDTIRLTLPMAPVVIEVNDRDFSNKRPLAIERGPLLYCLPIEPKWVSVPGNPLTPLPEGWSWFEATPNSKWNYAVNLDELRKPGSIEVVERPATSGNPWHQSTVILRIPAREFTSAFSPGTRVNVEIYRNLDGLLDTEKRLELVPYGCANLRVSYFPRYSAR